MHSRRQCWATSDSEVVQIVDANSRIRYGRLILKEDAKNVVYSVVHFKNFCALTENVQ
jgi:hypothetical protein